MNRDFLLAIALSFLVLLASRYLLEPYLRPEPAGPTPEVEQPSPEAEARPPAPDVIPRTPLETLRTGVPKTRKAPAEQFYSVETDLFKLSFSNRGAVVKEWVLKRYQDANGEALNLIDEAHSPEAVFPMALIVENPQEVSGCPADGAFSQRVPAESQSDPG